LRAKAFAAFDAGKRSHGEALWAKYLAVLPEAESRLARSAQRLETALSLDGRRDDVRERLGEALLQRALLAEQADNAQSVVADLLERLKLYDVDGERMKRWTAPARFSLVTEPPGATVALERYDDERRRIDKVEALGVTPLSLDEVARGSYRLRF